MTPELLADLAPAQALLRLEQLRQQRAVHEAVLQLLQALSAAAPRVQYYWGEKPWEQCEQARVAWEAQCRAVETVAHAAQAAVKTLQLPEHAD